MTMTQVNFYWNENEKVYLTGKVKNLSRRLTKRPSDALSKIFKFKVLKKNNPRLFRKTRLRIRQDGYETLEFKENNEWKVIYTRQNRLQEWQLKNEFVINNPMENDITISKEKYDQSATKQVDEMAGVDIDEQVADDIIGNVLGQMLDDIDQTETPTTSEAVNEQDILQEKLKTKTVDVSEVQARLETLESVNRTLEKNLRMKEYELNELKVRNANDDVVNEKEQEIDNLQEKLKKTESERVQLLLDVNVSNELLSVANENLRELTQKYNEVTEKFNQFKEVATREMEAQKREIVNRYRQEQKYDKEQARQEYAEGMAQLKQEFSKKMSKSEAEKIELQSELVKARQEIKYLKEAEHKQHKKPDPDSTDRVVPGVQESIDRIYDIIEKSDPKYNELSDNELSDNELEKLLDANLDTFREQAKKFEQKAKNSKGVTK